MHVKQFLQNIFLNPLNIPWHVEGFMYINAINIQKTSYREGEKLSEDQKVGTKTGLRGRNPEQRQDVSQCLLVKFESVTRTKGNKNTDLNVTRPS